MATIKAFTNIQQSKKLAEILPIESADMHYVNGKYVGGVPYLELKKGSNPWVKGVGISPCWSLTALFSVLPKEIVYNEKIVFLEFHVWENSLEYVNNADYTLCATDSYNNPIDACYEMILTLKELNLLRL